MQNKKLLFVNTVALYVRMLFTMGIGLFTSREVLRILGVEDFGLYNLVGGIVVMLSFLNTAMVQASQRFMAVEVGKGTLSSLKKVFCTSMATHATIAVIVLLVAETVGLWFVNTHLVILPERMLAANFVYQFSVISFVCSVLCVPYSSAMIAHEHFKCFAYIGMYESVMKLLVLYMLIISPFDKLISYAFLILAVQMSAMLFNTIYCNVQFKECHLDVKAVDLQLYRSMFSFAGWSFLGNLGMSMRDQGSNIIINLFCGTALNAARGIAGQVSGMVNSFSNNFAYALTPQITKLYATGNIAETRKLVYSGARLIFFLFTFVSVPLLTSLDYVLVLWLRTVPPYTHRFLVIILLSALMYTMSQTLTMVIQATGQIRKLQILICILTLLELPAAYIILYMHFTPTYAVVPMLVSNFVACYVRMFVLKGIEPTFSFREYTLHVVVRCLSSFALCLAGSWYIRKLFYIDFFGLFCVIVLSTLFSSVVIYFIGFKGRERRFVNEKVNAIVQKIRHK